jgi:anti-anti-sigma factor
MEQRIRTAYESGAVILELEGPLRMGPYLNDFAAAAQAALGRKPRAVIVDFTHAGSLDTAAIGELIQLNSRAAAGGVRLCLAGLAPRLRRLLETMRLDGLLNCHADRAEALEAARRPL